MEKKLQVRNLRISFRTSNGKVQAVRDINFDLDQGETLAIVGESGSGKSVTSKAILGILAGNSIVESGEIIYDGKDLLKISEEDFHKIRGDKIAMIFQDPMSSLNPIIRIGRQLTEAMLLKGKARQRECRNTFNTYLKNLNDTMIEAIAEGDSAKAAELTANCKNFDKFEFKHIELEKKYKMAHEAAVEAVSDLDTLIFECEKKQPSKDAAYWVKDVEVRSKESVSDYVVTDEGQELLTLSRGLSSAFASAKKDNDYSVLLPRMEKIRNILKRAVAKPVPNFFRMGYYVTFSGKPLPDMPVEELNAFLLEYLNNNFMLAFIDDAKIALKYSADRSYKAMQDAIKELKDGKSVFDKAELDHKECKETADRLEAAVKATIDELAITKDSLSYTFGPAVRQQIENYFKAIHTNVKAVKAYERDKRKYDRIVASGKKPEWEVADAAVTDLDLIKKNIERIIDRLVEHYEELLATSGNRDYDKETVGVIDFLMENASGVIEKITKRIARDKAIKLMDEVGIAEPHKRYNQYPFEFSGGMRQRIVIAIALAANPDILICDEPTTALDVTIQSQILELINKLKEERKLTVIFITHDLGVVANMADRVAVMYAGKIVEYGTSEDIFYHAAHPYTWALLSSMPDLDTNERLEAIPGTPPNMIYPPKGDAFAPRNKYAMQIDFEKQPPMFKISDSHYAATWLLHPDAPKVEPPKIIQDRIRRMQEKRGQNNG
ncbi:MAG: ATP-binding cassette domain-containing protein [Lachnospiraceae bacterium]|nr:ATP-binding cassette domain-containing protein [Lachnospiraceae bacterium]